MHQYGHCPLCSHLPTNVLYRIMYHTSYLRSADHTVNRTRYQVYHTWYGTYDYYIVILLDQSQGYVIPPDEIHYIYFIMYYVPGIQYYEVRPSPHAVSAHEHFSTTINNQRIKRSVTIDDHDSVCGNSATDARVLTMPERTLPYVTLHNLKTWHSSSSNTWYKPGTGYGIWKRQQQWSTFNDPYPCMWSDVSWYGCNVVNCCCCLCAYVLIVLVMNDNGSDLTGSCTGSLHLQV